MKQSLLSLMLMLLSVSAFSQSSFDVLVVYTPAAEAFLESRSSVTGVANEIRSYFDAAEISYLENSIEIELLPVHLHKVVYNENVTSIPAPQYLYDAINRLELVSKVEEKACTLE